MDDRWTCRPWMDDGWSLDGGILAAAGRSENEKARSVVFGAGWVARLDSVVLREERSATS